MSVPASVAELLARMERKAAEKGPDPAEMLAVWDESWALGELMQLTWRAKCARTLPHLHEPELFHACLRVIHSLPFEEAQALWNIWQRMNPANDYRHWSRRAHSRAR